MDGRTDETQMFTEYQTMADEQGASMDLLIMLCELKLMLKLQHNMGPSLRSSQAKTQTAPGLQGAKDAHKGVKDNCTCHSSNKEP